MDPEYRQVHLLSEEHINTFHSNYISTRKYSLLSLVPKNLFEQFHRTANIWFLIVSVFQVLPLDLSPTSSWATIAPLSMILALTMAKDAWLDYRRHQSDKEINNRPAKVFKPSTGKVGIALWQSIRPGEILVLEEDEPVPCDLLLLNTSTSESNCLIETSNLDGETNLKVKNSVQETSSVLEAPTLEESLKQIRSLKETVLYTEQPNTELHSFLGSLKLKGHPRSVSVDLKNLVLRGSTIKNTKWTIGVAVFTGPDTKIMMNSKSPPHKRSKVERLVNKYLFIVFSILLATTLVSSIISVVHSYLNPEVVKHYSGDTYSGLVFVTFMILYNGLVPISLYVSMDFIRVVQAMFIQWDLRMYHEPLDRPAIAKTGDLNEDLGQVEYLFSDKTGTLTENAMEFKKCLIKGKVYQLDQNLEESGIQDPELLDDIDQKGSVWEFFELLALCHTVIASEQKGEIKYEAASPDEEVLVESARYLGFSFVSSNNGVYRLEIQGQLCEYKVIGVNEFTSERKRMSIVVIPMNDLSRAPVLYCKGADSVVLPRCNSSFEEEGFVNQHLTEFSLEGLRTLVFAKRELTLEEAGEFEKKYHSAKNALSDRNKRLEELAEEYERNMELLGATAIEDKIQDEVPDTIAALREAGVKVWVLTGDKKETAANIAYSCRLLEEETNLCTVNAKSVEEARSLLKDVIKNHIMKRRRKRQRSVLESIIKVPSSTPTNSGKFRTNSPNTKYKFVHEDLDLRKQSEIKSLELINIALLVDGESLGFILNDLECMKMFCTISCVCTSVLCCRVSPLQKAEVVKFVKKHFSFKPQTLAIGDGGNDVSMIQEAHVGVGVCGKEGMQAVNSSDYAVARFHHLLPLLLVHGRNNYRRISIMILYSFYKNFLLVLPMFYYTFLNLYSGTALYDSWLIISYNILLTSLPILVLGVFDKDVSEEKALRNPDLYRETILGKMFNLKVFLKWTFYSLVHSAIIFFVLFATAESLISPEGKTESLNSSGTLAFHSVVQTATLVIFLEMKDWSWLFILVVGLSAFAIYPFLLLYDYGEFPTYAMQGIFHIIFSAPPQVMYLVLTPFACFFVNFLETSLRSLWFPQKIDLIKSHSKIVPRTKYEENLVKTVFHLRSSLFSTNLSSVFVKENLKTQEEDQENKSSYNLNSFSLKFKSAHIEHSFKAQLVKRVVGFSRVMIILISLFYICWNLVYFLSASIEDDFWLRVGSIILVVLLLGLIWTEFFKKHYEGCILFIIASVLGCKFLLELFTQNDASMSTAMVPIATFIIFNVNTLQVFVVNLFFLLLYFIRVFWVFYRDHSEKDLLMLMLNYGVLLTGIFLISGYIGRQLERGRRSKFILQRQLEHHNRKFQEILGNLLPPFVKEKVKHGVRYIAEQQPCVSIVFCDIAHFDTVCATHTPHELIELLDGFFGMLDNLCEKHGLTKIETVNKTYMACGGLTDSEKHLPKELLEQSHSERCVNFALNALKKLELTYLKTGEKFQVKIGINSGPVIAGIVGEHKPQFCLVGDTVNTAARMTTTIKEPDNVQISESTFTLLPSENYNFSPNQIEAKGKGILNTYFVTKALVKRATLRLPERSSLIPEESVWENSFSCINSLNEEEKEEGPRLFENNDPEAQVKQDETHLKLAGPVEWVVCNFEESERQREFRVSQIEKNMRNILIGLWVTIGIYAAINTMFVIDLMLGTFSPTEAAIRVLCNIGMVGLACYYKKVYKHYMFFWCLTLFYTLVAFVSMISLDKVPDLFIYSVVLEIMYNNVVINHVIGLTFGYILIGTFMELCIWITISVKSSIESSMAAESTFFIVAFLLLNLTASFVKEFNDRKTFNLNKRLEREISNTENLLNQMIPLHVLKNLQRGIVTTDKYSEVTILYADVCGFTNWSSTRTPLEVISMLSKFFVYFDHLCVKHDVYKVHTIGDCYVVLSFTETEDRNPAKESVKVVNIALDMIKVIKKVNKSKGLDLKMRIGIHTGTVIAGITGTNIVRYDIYGPDNDIANKMESGGVPGKINVSKVTKDLLISQDPERFDFIYNKEITHSPTSTVIDSYLIEPFYEQDVVIGEELKLF